MLPTSSEGPGFNSAWPPFPSWVSNTFYVITSNSTGWGIARCMPVLEGRFRMVYNPGLWSRSSTAVKFLPRKGWQSLNFTLPLQFVPAPTSCRFLRGVISNGIAHLSLSVLFCCRSGSC